MDKQGGLLVQWIENIDYIISIIFHYEHGNIYKVISEILR